MSIINNVKNERQYRASTGLTEKNFITLLEVYKKYFVAKQTVIGSLVKTGTLQSPKEALFFILFFFKTGLTLQQMGILFNISDTCALDHINRNKKYLLAALKEMNCLALGLFNNSKEAFEKAFEGVEEIYIDATEIRVVRPENEEIQKDLYSGKKKQHTVKCMVFSDANKKIIYVSECVKGTMFDSKLFDKIANNFNFKDKTIWVDTAFIGLKKSLINTNIKVPIKKKQGQELSANDKSYNRYISSNRVLIEHVMSDIKRYAILKNKSKMLNFNSTSEIVAICAGLCNLTNSGKKFNYNPLKSF